MSKIVVDAMGSDGHPLVEAIGAVAAAREYGVEVLLVGDEALVGPALQAQNPGNLPVRIVHAPEQLTMDDKGMSLVLKARRPNSRTSLAVGLDLVKNGEADAFVSAGNTGAVLATAYFRLGNLPGVERAALAPPFPTAGGYCTVLDVGANPECQPENLLQFGVMGSLYAEKVRGIKNPRVGLLANGEEAGKGTELVKQAFALLEKSGLNFVGNVEGKEIFGGEVDVTVADGFSGNILLKSSEAVAKLLMDTIKDTIKKGNLQTQIGGLLVKPALSGIKKMMDPSEEGAAPLLGVNGLVFKGHGRSDALAIQNAIRVANEAVQAGVLASIRAAIEDSLKS